MQGFDCNFLKLISKKKCVQDEKLYFIQSIDGQKVKPILFTIPLVELLANFLKPDLEVAAASLDLRSQFSKSVRNQIAKCDQNFASFLAIFQEFINTFCILIYPGNIEKIICQEFIR